MITLPTTAGTSGYMMLLLPTITPVAGSRNLVILAHDYSAVVLGWRITVKAGFEFDGASIPRILWTLVGHPFRPDLMAAALLHDLLYSSESLSRFDCDNVFREAMALSGVNPVTVHTYYRAVRTFGWAVWMQHEPKWVAHWKTFAEVVPVEDLPCAA